MGKKEFNIDMWHGNRFIPKKYNANAHFYPHGSFGYVYRGNIYDDAGKTVGDYGANDSGWIEDNFKIKWKD